MFPFRYGRRNSGGNTRTHGSCGGVSKLILLFLANGLLVSELRSGRGHHQSMVCCGDVCVGQALGLLVPVGWALLLYTSGLSTQSSTGGLTRLTRWETSS